MLSKEKILKYMDSRISDLKRENNYDNNLDNDCIGKAQFVEGSSRALRAMEETRAFIDSELAEE